jgi:hypothetical protein
MATKKSLGTIILIVLALALLFALNPSTADFQAWRSGQAQAQAGGGNASGLTGVMKKASGAVAGAMTGAIAGLYKRMDYLVCSTYSIGNESYLGIARLFIKLK